jgi:hypothetical protein
MIMFEDHIFTPLYELLQVFCKGLGPFTLLWLQELHAILEDLVVGCEMFIQL